MKARARMAAVVTITAVASMGVLDTAPVQAVGSVSTALPVRACGGEQPARPGGGWYTCSFEDDFNGTKVDTTKWVVQDTSLSGVYASGSSCYVNDPDNVSVSSGALRLTARTESPFTCRSPYGNFTSTRTVGTIASWSRFTQTYGRFEFRAKMPSSSVTGLHSALWLYPQQHTYGAWPSSGEIDVAEWFSGQPRNVYPSVHYAGENVLESTGYDCVVDYAGSAYHRYAVEWTTTTMSFYYDGDLCFTHDWEPDAPLSGSQPFDKPFYLVLTQIFGEGWNAAKSTSASSGTMLVDWVRAWK